MEATGLGLGNRSPCAPLWSKCGCARAFVSVSKDQAGGSQQVGDVVWEPGLSVRVTPEWGCLLGSRGVSASSVCVCAGTNWNGAVALETYMSRCQPLGRLRSRDSCSLDRVSAPICWWDPPCTDMYLYFQEWTSILLSERGKQDEAFGAVCVCVTALCVHLCVQPCIYEYIWCTDVFCICVRTGNAFSSLLLDGAGGHGAAAAYLFSGCQKQPGTVPLTHVRSQNEGMKSVSELGPHALGLPPNH